MGDIWQLVAGKNEKTTQHGTQTQDSSRSVASSLKQPYDLLRRAMVDQMVNPPNTAVSVPQQQALSSLQAMFPMLQGQASGQIGLAGALSGRGVPGAGMPNFGQANYLPTGQPQFGLQSREQMGLPDRSSYFPNMPTNEQIQQIGMPSVRKGDASGRPKKGKKKQEKWDQSHIA